MKTSALVIPAVAGTSAMTLFSWLAAEAEQEKFEEPVLLADLEKDMLPADLKRFAGAAGWATHYGIGLLFAGLYTYLRRNNAVHPLLKSGVVFGALSGLGGIAVWKTVFMLHPRPPRIRSKSFYRQLFLAHLIFGMVVQSALKPDRSSKRI